MAPELGAVAGQAGQTGPGAGDESGPQPPGSPSRQPEPAVRHRSGRYIAATTSPSSAGDLGTPHLHTTLTLNTYTHTEHIVEEILKPRRYSVYTIHLALSEAGVPNLAAGG